MSQSTSGAGVIVVPTHTNRLKPPHVAGVDVTLRNDNILLITYNRPKQMNSITHTMNWQLQQLFDWFDAEPTLRVAVITGTGMRAFCCGSDLKEIERAGNAKLESDELKKSEPYLHEHPRSGSTGSSRRRGKKPVLVAVNGLALGGGLIREGLRVGSCKGSLLTCPSRDIAIASPTAKFGLPEARVGVYAYGGGLLRLVHAVGMQRATDIALTCRQVPAEEALRLGLIAGISKTPESVLEEKLAKAKEIANISPDGTIVTRAGLREAWETGSIERAFQVTHEQLYDKLIASENCAEGLGAFRTKRQPKWKDSKL
ncbi:uncharacterized protein MYCFIDRAFT_141772 [Pseudocercospora fijiensis CIRAD86]|uniref:Uncharacterized protein n=1 Tax=Pseudocercospora fijiensis (strain CIRAD86) TaxID=383855 RepID=M2YSJ0_PSEFD|nr:uncharacterized protein MYCFIDRAFT_141772 [Pseudocercospora fijiensis CIRAD86]EME80680.1 hypothetical protein MYCFIDRAFT_141772 [Pseudocercospora fijiensis CIRAD86]